MQPDSCNGFMKNTVMRHADYPYSLSDWLTNFDDRKTVVLLDWNWSRINSHTPIFYDFKAINQEYYLLKYDKQL